MLLGACTWLVPFRDIEETGPERCSNRVDDDLDGIVDCEDPSCAGYCPEVSARACNNGRDDDGDGLTDYEEPSCWPHGEVIVGGSACRSRFGSTIRLAAEGPAWRWGLTCGDECEAAAPWDGDGSARLSGDVGCGATGVLSSACDSALAPGPSTGADWEIEAELRVGPGGHLAIVVGADLGAPPLASARDAAIVGVGHRPGRDGRAELFVAYVHPDGRAREAVLPASGGWLRMRITAAVARTGAECPSGELAVVLEDSASGARAILHGPVPAWTVETVLELGIQAASPGTAWVRELWMRRDRYDPCGHPVPQITAEDGGPAVVLGAALGRGAVVCAIGATMTAPHVERVYEPMRHYGTPPELDVGDPPAPARRFASWHSSHRALSAFTQAEVHGPARTPALDGLSVRAAELAWSEAGGFEGVLLVSDHPRRGGRLVHIASRDCELWQVTALDHLTEVLGPAVPVLLNTASDVPRLVLARPSEGFVATNDPRCCTEPLCPATDREQCERVFRERGFDPGSPDAPAECAVFESDHTAFIKPVRDPCHRYPRATLLEVLRPRGDAWAGSPGLVAAFPALPQWDLSCGCIGSLVNTPDRSYPAEVHQLLDAGGDRAFLATGRAGIELIVDTGEGTLNARSLSEPLLRPSGVDGTFDAVRVAEGQLLWLRDEAEPGTSHMLLFYRGFGRLELEPGGRVARYHGGGVSVVPVTVRAPRGPTRDAGADEPDCSVP
ncbi:MAG: hypothetical protein KF729_22765 [Sandaracinaceae bacterium]|nr:hypothetical protein [Sandaracinaceae bacterium]